MYEVIELGYPAQFILLEELLDLRLKMSNHSTSTDIFIVTAFPNERFALSKVSIVKAMSLLVKNQNGIH